MITPENELHAPAKSNNSSSSLIAQYFQRLHFTADDIEAAGPTFETLKKICANHLEFIPFENLGQHGARGGKQVLDKHLIREKVLERNRGGFCMELNNLLAELLLDIGFKVRRIPAFVYINEDIGYGAMEVPTHVVLLVTCITAADDEGGDCNCDYFVDVGFGEPCIEPLLYEIGLEHKTSDGMSSRLIFMDDTVSAGGINTCNDDLVVLEWWKHGQDVWSPRLCWKIDDAKPGDGLGQDCAPYMSDFQCGLSEVQMDQSIFEKKTIICKLTKTKKVSLAGKRLKITSPRFGTDCKVEIVELEDTQSVRNVLVKEFGIGLEETIGLDLGNSNSAPPEIWSQF